MKNSFKCIFRMKVITFEELFNCPNSENWLYEEVFARLLVASITFKAKSGKFIKVSEIYFISLLFFDTNFNRTKHKV